MRCTTSSLLQQTANTLQQSAQTMSERFNVMCVCVCVCVGARPRQIFENKRSRGKASKAASKAGGANEQYTIFAVNVATGRKW